MKVMIRKQLILESESERKLRLQHFINGTSPSPDELQQYAAMNAGITDPLLKNNLIHMNHNNKLIRGTSLDVNRDGIDKDDIKRNAEAQLTMASLNRR